MNLTVKPIVPFNNDYQSAYNFKFATFLDTIRTLGHNRGTFYPLIISHEYECMLISGGDVLAVEVSLEKPISSIPVLDLFKTTIDGSNFWDYIEEKSTLETVKSLKYTSKQAIEVFKDDYGMSIVDCFTAKDDNDPLEVRLYSGFCLFEDPSGASYLGYYNPTKNDSRIQLFDFVPYKTYLKELKNYLNDYTTEDYTSFKDLYTNISISNMSDIFEDSKPMKISKALLKNTIDKPNNSIGKDNPLVSLATLFAKGQGYFNLDCFPQPISQETANEEDRVKQQILDKMEF